MSTRMESESASVPESEIRAILRLLPHRYPFLLVDRVVTCVAGDRICGFKNVTRNESFVDTGKVYGLFMPDLFVIESIAQIAVILAYKTLNLSHAGQELFFFAAIDSARFEKAVRAGDRLVVEASITRLMPGRGVGRFAGFAFVDGCVVAQATLTAVMRSPKSVR